MIVKNLYINSNFNCIMYVKDNEYNIIYGCYIHVGGYWVKRVIGSNNKQIYYENNHGFIINERHKK